MRVPRQIRDGLQAIVRIVEATIQTDDGEYPESHPVHAALAWLQRIAFKEAP